MGRGGGRSRQKQGDSFAPSEFALLRAVAAQPGQTLPQLRRRLAQESEFRIGVYSELSDFITELQAAGWLHRELDPERVWPTEFGLSLLHAQAKARG
jgi:hypothetical protein